MSSRLIIHAPNVHAGGGRSLIGLLLDNLPAGETVSITADERLSLPIDEKPNLRVKRVAPTLWSRIGVERWLLHNVSAGDVVLCFGNLPPLFRLPGKVLVFLQNRYLVDEADLSEFSLTSRQKLRIERYWFSTRIRNADEIIVQTPSMRKLASSRIGDKVRISLFPFVADATADGSAATPAGDTDAGRTDFIYVASGEPHKNHRRLIEAWGLLAEQGLFPSLMITVDDSRFPALCEWIGRETRRLGLKVENVGNFENGEVSRLYRQAAALIYPSTLESFGLPLLEARAQGLPVVASELDYVRDLLNPQQSFDPESSLSIARAVKRHLGHSEQPLTLHDASAFIDFVRGAR